MNDFVQPQRLGTKNTFVTLTIQIFPSNSVSFGPALTHSQPDLMVAGKKKTKLQSPHNNQPVLKNPKSQFLFSNYGKFEDNTRNKFCKKWV